MANDLTTSTTPSTVPNGTVINTIDTGSGHTQVVGFQSATVTNTRTAASASSVTVQAANTARNGCTLYNDSNAYVNVKLGATASATDFTLRMAPNSYWEIPFGYNGKIDAIWDAATGSMNASEFTG